MHNKKAIIIGSGVAGMAAAIRLKVQGFDVDVYEKNNFPGGKLHSFEKGGFYFDAGPSLFTQPKNIEELFALAGDEQNHQPAPFRDRQHGPLDWRGRVYSNARPVQAGRNHHPAAQAHQSPKRPLLGHGERVCPVGW